MINEESAIAQWLIREGCEGACHDGCDCLPCRAEREASDICAERDRYRDALRGLVKAYDVQRVTGLRTISYAGDAIAAGAWRAALDALGGDHK